MRIGRRHAIDVMGPPASGHPEHRSKLRTLDDHSGTDFRPDEGGLLSFDVGHVRYPCLVDHVAGSVP